MPDQPREPDPSPDDEISEEELHQAAGQYADQPWQPPRGPLTKIVAWLILALMALAVLAMLATLFRSFF